MVLLRKLTYFYYELTTITKTELVLHYKSCFYREGSNIVMVIIIMILGVTTNERDGSQFIDF